MHKFIQELQQRIEENYREYREDMLSLDKDTLFDCAGSIAAAEDVRYYMTDPNCISEEDAEYLLRFVNPFKMLMDVWEECLEDGADVFEAALEEVFYRTDNEERYVTTAFAEELREKYGEDVSINSAIISELLEIMERFDQVSRIFQYLGLSADAGTEDFVEA